MFHPTKMLITLKFPVYEVLVHNAYSSYLEVKTECEHNVASHLTLFNMSYLFQLQDRE